MMPSWCQHAAAAHPSASSATVLQPIPRTDALSRASVAPQQNRALKAYVSLCLQPVPHSVQRAVTETVVVLGYISPPQPDVLCMNQWNPTLSVLGRDWVRPLPGKEHILTGSIWECTPCWNVMPLDRATRELEGRPPSTVCGHSKLFRI